MEDRTIERIERIWGYRNRAGIIRVERRSRLIIELAKITSQSTILELGCGTGEYTKRFSQTGAKIVAIDISHRLIKTARERADFKNVTFKTADAENLPFEDSSFDAIVGNAVLHHLNLEIALKEIRRVLKARGIFVFCEPNMMNPQIFIQKNILPIKKLLGDSKNETAFFRWKIKKVLRRMGFRKIIVRPVDYLHPLIPRFLLPVFAPLSLFLEKAPLIKEFSGSLIVKGEK